MKKQKNMVYWYLGISSLLYITVYIFRYDLFLKSILIFWDLFIQISPFLIAIFIFMFLTIQFIKPKKIRKHLGKEAGLKGIGLTILAGIISTGPAYLWYPLIKELKDNGMTNKLIAIFIYNRSIKIHLLPMLIFFFGIKYSITLLILTVVFSIIVGVFVERFTTDIVEVPG